MTVYDAKIKSLYVLKRIIRDRTALSGSSLCAIKSLELNEFSNRYDQYSYKSRKIIIDHVDFSNCSFASGTFNGVKFSNVRFNTCSFREVVFNGCRFENCFFDKTNYFNFITFINPSFVNTYLNGHGLVNMINGFSTRGELFYQVMDEHEIKVNVAGVLNISSPQCVVGKALQPYIPEGDIIGYKALHERKICKLLIPAEATRTKSLGGKCRADKAIVLDIYDAHMTKDGTIDRGRHYDHGWSNHNNNFEYSVGSTVVPDHNFCPLWYAECESGIHFFLTEIEAYNYM